MQTTENRPTEAIDSSDTATESVAVKPSVLVIVGLGNPGAKYENTRHNIGVDFVRFLAERLDATWSAKTKLSGEVAETTFQGTKMILFAPQRYVNVSGLPVANLMRQLPEDKTELILAYDELDIPYGVVKLKYGGGAAGHNGVKDVAENLRQKPFWKLRIGIGLPDRPREQDLVRNFVLRKPPKVERDALQEAMQRTLDVMPEICRGDFGAAQKKLHTIS